jgi:hypothetical protein
MNAFAVVVALAAVAALGWALTAVAKRILRRFGVPTDERSEATPAVLERASRRLPLDRVGV